MIALIVILSILGVLLIFLLVMSFIIHKKFFGYHGENDPDITYFTKEEYGINAREVSFKLDGKTLKGYIFEKENKYTDKLIVFCHGMWSTVDAYMQDIAFYVLNGYQVLAFNYYGVAKSEGKTVKGFKNSLASADAALKYIKETPELKDKEIYVTGHSWGGYATINIVKYHPEVKKIAALSPFVSSFKITNATFKGITKVFVPFIIFWDSFSFFKFFNVNGIKSLNNYKGKALIVQSTDDQIVPYKSGLKLLQGKVKNKNVKYMILDGKMHHPHYSDNAIKSMITFTESARLLSGDALKEYKRNYNFHEMGELDLNVMNRILKFFNE